jgi:FMN phosphatase YigB (HAD superfamily)
MQMPPADCLYVGDVYSIDYVGAKSAGFDALLFDVCGAYKNDGLPRVESLPELQSMLAQESKTISHKGHEGSTKD